MDSRSLLEFLEQEKKICDRLQSVQNMLGGLNSAAEDNRTSLERHSNLMDRLTEEATGKQVIALPIEATALGNLKIQMEVNP